MMTTYRDLLPIAIKIAVDAHGSVIGKDGRPYILHPLRLMSRANGYDEQIVAVLHDTIEDTDVTMETLAAAGFPPEILEAIGLLTHREEDSYDAYLARIAENPLASRVKLLDLHDNIDTTRLHALTEKDLARIAKYHRSIRRLEGTYDGPVELEG